MVVKCSVGLVGQNTIANCRLAGSYQTLISSIPIEYFTFSEPQKPSDHEFYEV